jgi:hypothetical protein
MNRQGPIRPRIGDRLGSRGRRAPQGAAATWRIEGDPEVAWIKLDDKFAHDPKFRAIAPAQRFAAIGVWAAAIGFAQCYETDGAVREADVGMLAPPDAVPDPAVLAELVRVGLFDASPDGWAVHKFLAHNLSKQQRAQLRNENAERNAARQRRFRRRKKRKESGLTDTSETVTDVSHRDKTLREKVTPSSDRDRDRDRERENPPLPPLSPGAPTATGSDPSFSLSVPNPDSPDQEAAAMPDDADADQRSRDRQWQDDTRQRELGKFADWAERHGHPEVAAQIREQAKVRRPLSGPPPKPDSPDPDTVAAILARSAQRWEAFFACNRRKHPGHSDQTCPEKPPSPARAADAQARAEFGPGADDPVDESAP